MSTSHSGKRMIACICLVVTVVLASSCAPAPAPTPTSLPTPTASPTPSTTSATAATPTSVATETPVPSLETASVEEVLYLPEIPRITCEELKQFMDEGTDLVLVDTRVDFSFNEGHLPGAINIPGTPLPPLTEEMIAARLLMLPRDKLVVLYCD